MHSFVAMLMLASILLGPPATPGVDGLHIMNGGSTNARGWEIAFRSDGSAAAKVTGSAARTLHVRSDLVMRTFADVKAARASSGRGWRSCIKSASFGSVTRVRWHGWISPDLACPATSAAIAALAADVAELQAQARLVTPQRRQVPPEVRRVPPSKGR